MSQKYTEPKNLRETLDYIKMTIRRMDDGEIWRGDAAGNIVGATLCNNTYEFEEYAEQYPDMITLTDLAADLELEEETPETIHSHATSFEWLTLRTLVERLDKLVTKN